MITVSGRMDICLWKPQPRVWQGKGSPRSPVCCFHSVLAWTHSPGSKARSLSVGLEALYRFYSSVTFLLWHNKHLKQDLWGFLQEREFEQPLLIIGVFTNVVRLESDRGGPWWALCLNSKKKFNLIFSFGIAPMDVLPPHILSGLRQIITAYTNKSHTFVKKKKKFFFEWHLICN